MINNNKYKKDYYKSIIEYFKINIYCIIVITICTLSLSYYSDKKYMKGLNTIIIVSYISWLFHYLMHNYNKYNPISKIHLITHHSDYKDTFLGKCIEYFFIEFIFFGPGLLLILNIILQTYYNVHILNSYIILFWGILIITIHEIYYHTLDNTNYHEIHHYHQDTNYSAEMWDIVNNTKKKGTPIENNNKMIPFILVITVCIIPFIKCKYDFINND